MIVKVLQNKEGKYLKDYGLETVDELFHPVTGLMCYWGCANDSRRKREANSS